MTEFKGGSEEAFSKIYGRFYKPIFSYVRTKIPNPATAEEITQEIFLKVHRFRDSYEERFAFSTWLWTISRNTVSDHLRGTRAAAATEGFSDAANADVLPEEIPAMQDCAETIIIKKDNRKRLLRMMRSLTRPQKKVLWMRIVHQRSYDEIAKALGLSMSAVKNLVYRAKLTLSDDFNLAPVFA